jgi:hypothetical protein
MLKVTYKHWKTGLWLEAIGTMPENYNNGSSDRVVVKQSNGVLVDIIKSSIVRVQEWSPR